MENKNFLVEVLTSDSEYWLVAKKNEKIWFNAKRFDDDIIFLSIPQEVNVNKKREELLLSDLEQLQNTYSNSNIFLSTDFPPFQIGQNFYNIYKWYPVKKKHKEFLQKALLLKSNDIHEYKKILDEINKND
jgi:hypothetical protein